MKLDRNSIERRDFPAARRGYDPDEVEAHLARIADAVEQLKGSSGAAGTTAERVRSIVEAAERSAAEIEAGAREEAERSRARARAEVAESLRRADEAEDLLAQAGAELERLRGALGTLRSTLSGPADDAAGAEPRGERTPAAAGEAEVEPEPEQAPQPQPEPARAPEPEPEPPGSAQLEPEPVPDADEAVAEAQETPAEAAHDAAPPAAAAEPPAGKREGVDGARLIALNMALNGTPREETERYLEENFDLDDPAALLDDVYS